MVKIIVNGTLINKDYEVHTALELMKLHRQAGDHVLWETDNPNEDAMLRESFRR